MVAARTRTTSLWALIDAMQRRLEGEGLEAQAVDAEVARGLRSLLCRDMFASARRAKLAADEPRPLALEAEHV